MKFKLCVKNCEHLNCWSAALLV